LLPVAAIPSTRQTSCTSTSPIGTTTQRMSTTSGRSTITIAIAQSACMTPLA
jgi:hypothetical protein